MKKLFIIGIDGLDRKYVEENISNLPNFKKIIDKSPQVFSQSVFPPDSDTAWTTIYTGLNPAKHGVVDFVDPLERYKTNKKEYEYSNVKAFQGKTFWDVLSNNGKKVCVIYPHMATPCWAVNGCMININPETENMEFYPSNLNSTLKLDKIHVLKRIPRTKIEFRTYLDKKREIVVNEFELAKKMLTHDDWDLFFLYSSSLDTLMHIFWNYCDKEDPTYPGPNQFEDVIIELHKLYDKKVGEFLDSLDDDSEVLFISDHGHFRRPTKLLNINEILRLNGFLTPKGNNLIPLRSSKEKFKRIIVDIAQKSGMRPAAQTVLRIFPKIKNMYTKPSNIDFEKTLAHCTDLSGMKAYNYGGIKVYREKYTNEDDFTNAKREIIRILKEIKIPGKDTGIFEWIKMREELYQGPFLEKYPEILFNLVEDYGSGWSINGDLWAKSLAHKFFPGSHRGSTPIFYFYNYLGEIQKKSINLEDIFPTIMAYFGMGVKEEKLDGQSII